MNTKTGNQNTTSAMDYAKYALATLIAASGVYVFYAFLQWPGPVRGLLVALSFVLALVVFGFTAQGLKARQFYSDSIFELRKVVWPTREQSLKVTGMVLVVVVIISLVLAAFDWVISLGIKLLLGS